MRRSKKIIKNTASNIFLQVVMAAVQFVSLPFLLKHFGKEVYGIFILAYSVYTFAFFLNSAIQLTLMKYVSQEYAKKDFIKLNSVINNMWIVGFLNHFFVALCMFLIAYYGICWFNISATLQAQAQQIFIVIGLCCLVKGFFSVYGGVLCGLQKIHENNLINSIELILRVCIIYYVVCFGKSLLFYVCGLNILFVSVSIGQYMYTKKVVPEIKIHLRKFVNFREFKDLFGFNFCQIINSVSDILMYNSDKLIIQKVMGISSIVMYEVANKPNLLFQRFVSLPLSAILPACSDAYARKDKDFLNKILIQGTRFYLTLILPVI